LIDQANKDHAKMESVLGSAVRSLAYGIVTYALPSGAALIEIKKRLRTMRKNGELLDGEPAPKWGAFLKKYFRGSQSIANKYMRVARHRDKVKDYCENERNPTLTGVGKFLRDRPRLVVGKKRRPVPPAAGAAGAGAAPPTPTPPPPPRAASIPELRRRWESEVASTFRTQMGYWPNNLVRDLAEDDAVATYFHHEISRLAHEVYSVTTAIGYARGDYAEWLEDEDPPPAQKARRLKQYELLMARFEQWVARREEPVADWQCSIMVNKLPHRADPDPNRYPRLAALLNSWRSADGAGKGPDDDPDRDRHNGPDLQADGRDDAPAA
jgi:hypothetical protein